MSLEQQQLAWKLLQQAYQAQMHGDYDHAIELYTKSLDIFPTAEAHTFLGVTYHFQGKVDQAIAECKRAIEVDPEFGNPYNDIGAYLINKGELDEAVQWLEKAKHAPRYDPRHFPYMNLGKLYARKGMVMKAIAEFEEALRLAQHEAGGDPNASASICDQLRDLRAMLN